MGNFHNTLVQALAMYLMLSALPVQSQTVLFGQPETITQTNSASAGASIAFDSAHRAHISFIDRTSGNRLVYANWTGSGWSIKFFHNVIVTSADIPTSIVLDSSGRPHIFISGNHDYIWLNSSNVWQYEEVGQVDASPNIEMGNDARPRVAYIELNNTDRLIRYAERTAGGAWAVETVASMANPSPGEVSGDCGLALNSSNVPFVSYQDADTQNTYYAYKLPGYWLAQAVEWGSAWSGRLNDIHIDASNRVQMVYTNDTQNAVIVAMNSSSGWSWNTIATGVEPRSLNMDIAPNGTIGVGMAVGTSVRVYRRTGTSWTLDTIESSDQASGESITFDAFNAAGVGRGGQNGQEGALYYSRLSGAVWVSQQVYNGGFLGSNTLSASSDGKALAYSTFWPQQILVETDSGFGGYVDPGPGAHQFGDIEKNASTTVVSYYNSAETSLRVADFGAYPPSAQPDGWLWETIDNAADVGKYTSVALDEASNIYVSYFDETNDDLKFAQRINGVWETTIVDSIGNVGRDTSIALDASNKPAISYFDIINANLKFAYFDGSVWNVSTVDSVGQVGEYSQLVYDNAGIPHILYFDRTNSRLKWAKGPAGSWTINSLPYNNLDGHFSLAVDFNLNPHVVYRNPAGLSLKYAVFSNSEWKDYTLESGTLVGYSPEVRLSGNKVTVFYLVGSNSIVKRVDGAFDYSPPATPVVTDEGSLVTTDRIAASWQAVTDPETGLSHYEYAVGDSPTDPGSGYLIGWTNTTETSINRTDVTLVSGKVYYVYVRAVNNVGQKSGIGISDGIRRVADATRIGDAKKLPDGTWVHLEGKVSSRQASIFFTYIQEPDRSAGIMIYSQTGSLSAASIPPGRVLTVTGELTTRTTGRAINNPIVSIGALGPAPAPIHLKNRDTGGMDFFYNPGPPVSGEQGSPGSLSVNNVGLFSRISGRVTEIISPILYRIDDGSIPGGILITHSSSFGQPTLGQYVEVIGHPRPGGSFAKLGSSPLGWRLLAP